MSCFSQLQAAFFVAIFCCFTLPSLNKASAHRLDPDLEVQKWIQSGADLNAIQETGLTFLMQAAQWGALQGVPALLRAGAEVNRRGKDGETALHMAALFFREKIVDQLLAAGAEVDARDARGWTPLFEAVSGGAYLTFHGGEITSNEPDALPVVQRLLKAGADVNAKDRKDITPIDLAATRNYPKIVEALLSAGAQVNRRNQPGFTPLLIASQSDEKRWADHSEMIQSMLKHGAKPNDADSFGKTPLMWATVNGYPGGVQALIRAGADVSAKDRHESTALSHVVDCKASEKQCLAVAKQLIDAGADVNAQDGDGDTTLLMAAKKKQKALTDLLLQSKADPSVKDKKGESAEPLLKQLRETSRHPMKPRYRDGYK